MGKHRKGVKLLEKVSEEKRKLSRRSTVLNYSNGGNENQAGDKQDERMKPTENILSFYTSLFLRCRVCVTQNEVLCQHIQEQCFRACDSLKKDLVKTCSCKSSNEVHGMVKARLPELLSETFDAFEVERDGNCFYSAVSVCLKKNASLGKCLRQAAGIEYLMNTSLNQFLSRRGIPSSEVLAKMTDGIWADSTSMFIVSSVISRRIEVIEVSQLGGYSSCYYDANTSGSNESIHLFLMNCHFYPLIPKSANIKLPNADHTLPPFRHESNGNPRKRESNESENVRYLSHQHQLLHKENRLKKLTQDLENATTWEEYENVREGNNIPKMEATYLQRMKEKSNECKKNSNVCSTPTRNVKETKTYLSSPNIPLAPKRNRFGNKSGFDGRFKKDIEAKFQNCLQCVSRDIQYLQGSGEKEAKVKAYVLSCAQSRTLWIEKAPDGVILKKNQIQRRENYSKNVHYALLTNADLQQEFINMLTSLGLDKYAKSFSDEIRLQVSKLSVKNTKPEAHQQSDTNQDSCKVDKSHYKDEAKELEVNQATNTDILTPVSDEIIGRQSIADILEIDMSDLEYTPPSSFDLVLTPSQLALAFDFKKEIFINRKWASEISNALTKAQGACSFKARKQPKYPKRKGKSFALLEGYCGCELRFYADVKEKPSQGKPLTVSISTTGAFNLMQGKFTGRPLTGKERAEVAAKLQYVKAEAVFLDNINHLSALRLLHGNYVQASRDTLRKAKSEKKLENRLDPDLVKDVELQKLDYEKTSHPNAIIKGYVQYFNPVAGNFKIIMYDQGSLSMHADQASKSGTFCYFDATGGVIQKQSGHEILLYRLLGKRLSGCTYIIADMLSEKGTIVDVTDFLKRIKHGVLKVRPTFNKSMADMIVVDWSWPLLHAASNAWNTETLEDYLNRSFLILSELTTTTMWRNKCVIFICTSHLVHATYRNLCKRLHPSKEKKTVMPYALASIARLQECYTLEEFKSLTRDITRLFGKPMMSSEVLDELCMRLTEHKTITEKIMQDKPDDESEVENEAALDLANAQCQRLLREKSPFYHIFMREREKEMKTSEENASTKNRFYCPTVLDVFEKDKVAMFPFWSAAIPRKVMPNSEFLRETNATVESSFHQLKNLQNPNGRMTFPDFVRQRHEMHTAKNKDTLTKLLRHQILKHQEPTQLITEAWGKKKKKNPSHFSPKTVSSLQKSFSNGKEKVNAKMDTNSESVTESSLAQSPGVSMTAKVLFPQRGIPNIGNTCYVNAAVQLLLSLPELMNSVANKSPAQHFFNFIEDRLRSLSTKGLSNEESKQIFDHVNFMLNESGVKETYKLGIQYDIMEYIRSLLNLPGMEELKNQFQFTVVNNYFCSSCNQHNQFLEATDRMGIDISAGFETGINQFLTKPELSECSQCKKNTMLNNVILADKPNLLLIVANLLEGYLDSGGRYVLRKTKSNDDICRFLTINDTSYELHGFICHRGTHADFGHYVTYLNKGEDSFTCCDDSIAFDIDHIRGDIYVYVFRKVATNLSEA